MSKGALVNLDVSAFARLSARVAATPARVEAVRKRAVGTLSRRLKAEAARQVSALQLNLSPGQIAPYIAVKPGGSGGQFVSVTASNARLPLRMFRPRYSRRGGVTVMTWRDRGTVTLRHAFRLRGEVWQRAPYRGQQGAYAVTDGLVNRLPIAQLKGPSLKRTLQPVGRFPAAPNRDEVVANLLSFGHGVLRAELKRLGEVR